MSTNKKLLINFLQLKDDLVKEYPNMKLIEEFNEKHFRFEYDNHIICYGYFPEIRICTEVRVYNFGDKLKKRIYRAKKSYCNERLQ